MKNPEQRAFASILEDEGFDTAVLQEFADEIKFDGGHDASAISAQDLLDAFAETPTAPWRKVAWALGETYYFYGALFGDREPTIREALKVLLCVLITGITARHGEANQFDNNFNAMLVAVAKTAPALHWGQRDVLTLAVRSRDSDTGRAKDG